MTGRKKLLITLGCTAGIFGGIMLITAAVVRQLEKYETENGEVRLNDGWDLIGIQLDGAIRIGCLDPGGRVRERCIRYRDETAFPETVACRSALWFPDAMGWPVTTLCRTEH